MLRIIFNPNTDTNTSEEVTSYPPTALLNSELKKCFHDASIIFNKHLDEFPGRWNYSEKATGSAYLNLVTVLYCKLVEIRFATFGDEWIDTRDLHSIGRYLHTVALDYYQEEMSILDDLIKFERSIYNNRSTPFFWEYSTGGLQMLRNYKLLAYSEGEVSYHGNLQDFVIKNSITLSKRSEEVELKITKKLLINNTEEIEVPESVGDTVLDASVSLIDHILSAIDSSYSITNIGCKDEIKILRRGTVCDATSLNEVELSTINSQLGESPNLFRKLLKMGIGNGSIS